MGGRTGEREVEQTTLPALAQFAKFRRSWGLARQMLRAGNAVQLSTQMLQCHPLSHHCCLSGSYMQEPEAVPSLHPPTRNRDAHCLYHQVKHTPVLIFLRFIYYFYYLLNGRVKYREKSSTSWFTLQMPATFIAGKG